MDWPGIQDKTQKTDVLKAKWSLFQEHMLNICQDLSMMAGSVKMLSTFLELSHFLTHDPMGWVIFLSSSEERTKVFRG